MPLDFAHALGGRLRAVRVEHGLSLQDIEKKSNGRWKAVVIRSYERADRAVTAAKLAELAEFYGVRIADLLPDPRASQTDDGSPALILDLTALAALPTHHAGPLSRYAAAIQSQRGDYGRRILTIRAEDMRSLAIIYGKSPAILTEQLIAWGVLQPQTTATDRRPT
jgi:transcriptional regulator with XRE-family HTH domain